MHVLAGFSASCCGILWRLGRAAGGAAAVTSTQQSRGMVSVWVVVRTRAGIRCSAVSLVPGAAAARALCHWRGVSLSNSWRQVQLSRQGVLITDKQFLSDEWGCLSCRNNIKSEDILPTENGI